MNEKNTSRKTSPAQTKIIMMIVSIIAVMGLFSVLLFHHVFAGVRYDVQVGTTGSDYYYNDSNGSSIPVATIDVNDEQSGIYWSVVSVTDANSDVYTSYDTVASKYNYYLPKSSNIGSTITVETDSVVFPAVASSDTTITIDQGSISHAGGKTRVSFTTKEPVGSEYSSGINFTLSSLQGILVNIPQGGEYTASHSAAGFVEIEGQLYNKPDAEGVLTLTLTPEIAKTSYIEKVLLISDADLGPGTPFQPAPGSSDTVEVTLPSPPAVPDTTEYLFEMVTQNYVTISQTPDNIGYTLQTTTSAPVKPGDPNAVFKFVLNLASEFNRSEGYSVTATQGIVEGPEADGITYTLKPEAGGFTVPDIQILVSNLQRNKITIMQPSPWPEGCVAGPTISPATVEQGGSLQEATIEFDLKPEYSQSQLQLTTTASNCTISETSAPGDVHRSFKLISSDAFSSVSEANLDIIFAKIPVKNKVTISPGPASGEFYTSFTANPAEVEQGSNQAVTLTLILKEAYSRSESPILESSSNCQIDPAPNQTGVTRTYTLTSSDGFAGLSDISVGIGSVPSRNTITIQDAAQSPVGYFGFRSTPPTVEQGGAAGEAALSLTLEPQYSMSKVQLTTTAPNCTITETSKLDDTIRNFTLKSSDNFGTVTTETLDITVSGVQENPNISVKSSSPVPGCTVSGSSAQQGVASEITVTLAIDPKYSLSTPSMTLDPSAVNCSISSGPVQSGNNWTYTITSTDNFKSLTTPEMIVEVTGIKENPKVQVKAESGTGYTLSANKQQVQKDYDTEITLTLKISTGYELIGAKPTLTTGATGCSIGEGTSSDQVTWNFTLTSSDKFQSVSTPDITFTVEGIRKIPGQIVVVDTNTTPEGYTLETSPATQGRDTEVMLRLTIQPEYSIDSQPQITLNNHTDQYQITEVPSTMTFSAAQEVSKQYALAPKSGGAFPLDGPVEFSVSVSGIQKNMTLSVKPVSGDGYSIRTVRPAVQGVDSNILFEIEVDPAYSDSIPKIQVTAETPYTVQASESPLGSLVLAYMLTEPAYFLDSRVSEIAVTVAGLVMNPQPVTPPEPEPEPEPEKIRVENELNPEQNSSDTRLWPLETKERNNISTTTVRDKEIDALVDLARHHKEDAEGLDGDGLVEGIIVIEDLKETSKNESYVLTMTDNQFDTLAEEKFDRMTIQTPAGSFAIYDDAIQSIYADKRKREVTFKIDRIRHEGRPGVDATLYSRKKEVTSFDEAYSVRLVIPYELREGENLNAVAADYIREDGTKVPVTECYYDKALGGLVLHSSHLSKFGVVYRPSAFKDVGPDHWANPFVTFLTARGILDGSDGANYRPDAAVTRGECLELMSRALSAANLPSHPVQVYADLPTSSPAAKAASWIYYNNLAAVITKDGKFRPDDPITRQDMAALLNNIASGVGLRIPSKGLDSEYNDLNEIADYAKKSVVRLRSAGILTMAQNYKFNPKATLNRGEMAQIIANLMSNL